MKKTILGITICQLFCQALVFANELEQSQKLETLTVTTATKTERHIEGVAASISVVSEKDIETMGAESLKDVIMQTPGLIMQYGSFPNASSRSKSSIAIRGMSPNGTLFLLDGRRLSGEVKNPYDLDRIPANIIERIEIVKGPMSSLYGADAVGGVINIITKQPSDKPETHINVRYGANQDGDGESKNFSLNSRGKHQDLAYSFYLNKTMTSPYTQKEVANVYKKSPKGNIKPSASPMPPTGTLKDFYDVDVSYRERSDILTFGSRFDYKINDDNRVGFEFNKFLEERDGTYIGYFHPSNYKLGNNRLPIFNSPVNSSDENDRFDWSLDYDTAVNEQLNLKLRFYHSYYQKRNDSTSDQWADLGYASEAASAQNGMNANVDIKSFEAIASYALNDDHFITAGLERRNENREATVFDNTPNLTERSVNYKAAYIQDEWQINDSLNMIFGARYDQISNADNKATFRIGLVKNLSDLLNLRANFAQGYRTPDIREMYIFKDTPTGKQRGAEILGYNLKPEFTNSYELGLSGKQAGFSYSAAVFFNDIEDRIQDNVLKPGGIRTFENLDKAETKGFEFSASYQFNSQLKARFNWVELRTEDKSTGKDLHFNPERTLSLGLDYQVMPSLDLGILASYTGEQYFVESLNQGSAMETRQDSHTNDYTLVNLRANYQINKQTKLYAGIDNLFDEAVDDILGSNMGRFFFVGTRIKL